MGVLNEENLPRTLTLQGTDEQPILRYIDQTLLPYECVERETQDWCEVIKAIKTLEVRGAPALGVAGAAALVLWCSQNLGNSSSFHEKGILKPEFELALAQAAETIANARPTAVNLSWGVNRVMSQIKKILAPGLDQARSVQAVREVAFATAREIEVEDEAANRAIGEAGQALFRPNSRILTHCNAGSLATAFFGTALGVIYAAAREGKVARVYADETRPVNQGSRLTVWELSRMGVPTTLICDNMAASLMARGEIDVVVVGADRISAHGDVANKIGTYGVALAARYHEIPFYVAAPRSTIDFSLATGQDIPIEFREESEVLPRPLEGVEVYNPAFDVTPARLVTAIITEYGVFAPSELNQIPKR